MQHWTIKPLIPLSQRSVICRAPLTGWWKLRFSRAFAIILIKRSQARSVFLHSNFRREIRPVRVWECLCIVRSPLFASRIARVPKTFFGDIVSRLPTAPPAFPLFTPPGLLIPRCVAFASNEKCNTSILLLSNFLSRIHTIFAHWIADPPTEALFSFTKFSSERVSYAHTAKESLRMCVCVGIW